MKMCRGVERHRVSMLAALLESDDVMLPARLPGGVRIVRLAPAAWMIVPRRPDGQPIALSAGVHGDETAPVELLADLLDQLVAGNLELRVPLFAVFGNIAALRAGRRFLDVDLNRLFAGASPIALETLRAVALAEAFCQFAGKHPAPLHLDLHSAIRASHFERFAIYPNAAEALPDPMQMARLGACGIQAVLIAPDRATTFSAYSTRVLGGESYTIELGRVQVLGSGAADELADVRVALEAMLARRPLPAPITVPRVFRIRLEIVKQSDAFRLNVPDDAPNFTPLEAGGLIAEDGAMRWYAEDGDHIVFPNPAVQIGLRAGLLVQAA